MSGSLTDIKGVYVGNYTDEKAGTGCTAVLCPNGAVAGADVRGCAPGTRETDLLHGYNAVERIQAVMLCGGSAFGLDAASGAMKYLEEQQCGVDVGVTKVPIVPAAVIFDLAYKDAFTRPGSNEGYKACLSASDAPVKIGNVGAGTGATIGKAFGMEYSFKSGQGSCCIELEGGIKVAALAVVNALGDVYDPENGKIVAGAQKDGKFMPCLDMQALGGAAFTNTTIGVVATNATLNREQANKLASMAHDALALCIRPVHTTLDGDTFFAMSTCELEAASFLSILVAGVKAVSGAILSAVGIDK